MPTRIPALLGFSVLLSLFVLFTAFQCEDDDFRCYANPGTFLIGYGGGHCGGPCSSIFMLQDSSLYYYAPGAAPALGDGAANLDGWERLPDQSALADILALRDNLPQELLDANTDRFGCPGCADGPFAQVSLYEEESGGASRTWYINAQPRDGSVISDELRDYALAVQALVAELEE